MRPVLDWMSTVENTHYIVGSVVGPHPFPMMVRDFQSIIGRETRSQIIEKEGRLPDLLIACVGGGSNAIGIFHGFLDDPSVELYGFEAGGEGVDTDRHAATITLGRPGVLHGARSYLMQDEDGQIRVHSQKAPPAMFREGMGVIVEGKLNREGIFESSSVMVKHSNEYRPPEDGTHPKPEDMYKSLIRES